MIGVLELEFLLKKYGVDSSVIVNNNGNVLEYGEYLEIKKVLDYLILEVGLNSKKIEKCPSVLYYNVNAVRRNYEFLTSSEISISSINNCLHVLSTDPNELEECYDYVLSKYGVDILNKQTSILKWPLAKIKRYETLFGDVLEPSALLSAIFYQKEEDEVFRIINVCKKYNFKIEGNVFKGTPVDIDNIIKICRDNDIEISGSMFRRSYAEVENIIRICKENNIEITGTVFRRSDKELEDLLVVSKKYNIKFSFSFIFSHKNRTFSL